MDGERSDAARGMAALAFGGVQVTAPPADGDRKAQGGIRGICTSTGLCARARG